MTDSSAWKTRAWGVVLVNLATMAWATNAVLGRWLRDDVGPLTLTTLRFTVATAFFSLLLLRSGRGRPIRTPHHSSELAPGNGCRHGPHLFCPDPACLPVLEPGGPGFGRRRGHGLLQHASALRGSHGRGVSGGAFDSGPFHLRWIDIGRRALDYAFPPWLRTYLNRTVLNRSTFPRVPQNPPLPPFTRGGMGGLSFHMTQFLFSFICLPTVSLNQASSPFTM